MASIVNFRVLPLSLALLLLGILASATDTTTGHPEHTECRRLDAAITYDGIDYLFVGQDSIELDKGLSVVEVKDKYSDWKGLPRIDSALTWSGDDYPYFFQGNNYYSYYYYFTHGPLPNSRWTESLEGGVNAAGTIGEKSHFFTKHCALVTYEDGAYSEPTPLEDMGFPCEVDAALGLDDDRLAVIRNDKYWVLYHNETVSEQKDANSLFHLHTFRLCAKDEDDGELIVEEEEE